MQKRKQILIISKFFGLNWLIPTIISRNKNLIHKSNSCFHQAYLSSIYCMTLLFQRGLFVVGTQFCVNWISTFSCLMALICIVCLWSFIFGVMTFQNILWVWNAINENNSLQLFLDIFLCVWFYWFW
jgi:hypothetical protein